MVRHDLSGDRNWRHFFTQQLEMRYDMTSRATAWGYIGWRRHAKIFCVFAVKFVWGQENEGDTRRSTAWGWISHGRRSELKHGFRVGRARKCILSALYLGAEFLFELRFLSKGRETIDRYMANFCAAHVRTDVKKNKRTTVYALFTKSIVCRLTVAAQ